MYGYMWRPDHADVSGTVSFSFVMCPSSARLARQAAGARGRGLSRGTANGGSDGCASPRA
eukprot:6196413-Pleurochrysis_carterae.AAC.2